MQENLIVIITNKRKATCNFYLFIFQETDDTESQLTEFSTTVDVSDFENGIFSSTATTENWKNSDIQGYPLQTIVIQITMRKILNISSIYDIIVFIFATRYGQKISIGIYF